MVHLALCSAGDAAGPGKACFLRRELLLTLQLPEALPSLSYLLSPVGPAQGLQPSVTRCIKTASEEQLYCVSDISCMDPHFRKKSSTTPYYK